MGFFDRFKGKSSSKPPAPVEVEAASGVLFSPASGRVVPMSDVPDPVFAEGLLGKGCAVWPTDSVVFAPATGTVTVALSHAVGVAADDGAEVLVHVGLDTVEMNGAGFTLFVKVGDRVLAGQPLMRIDRKAIQEAGHPDCVVLAVSNSADLVDVSLSVDADTVVEAGSAVLKVAC